VLLPLLGLAAGVVLLVVAADRSVGEAESISEAFAISPIIVGALIVGLGTSLPEMVVSGLAASQRDSIDLAIGNFVGSNAANITLVLGAGAVLTRVGGRPDVFRREGVLVIGATVLAAALVVDGTLTRVEGGALVVAMMAAAFLLATGTDGTEETYDEQPNGDGVSTEAAATGTATGLARSVTILIVGLAAVVAGAQLLVVSAVALAEQLGVPEAFVGLSVVALGTSLPELATTVAAARRHAADLILGNIFGSNVFNSLAVAGLAGLVGTGRLEETPTASLAFMTVTTVAVVAVGATGRSFGRRSGVTLLVVYAATIVAAL
jgi:cation:H+ antiporter